VITQISCVNYINNYLNVTVGVFVWRKRVQHVMRQKRTWKRYWWRFERTKRYQFIRYFLHISFRQVKCSF